MATDNESWHLDKRVPIATICVLIVQAMGGVWFASQMYAELTALKAAGDAREIRLSHVETTTSAQAVSFATLSEQLAGLRAGMAEVKDTQRETNALLRDIAKGGKP